MLQPPPEKVFFFRDCGADAGISPIELPFTLARPLMSVFRSDLFEGKVALVTGGGTGICRGIAEALAAHGASTVIMSRQAEHLAPTAKAIAEAEGKPCLPLVADVRRAEQVEAAVAQALEVMGRIDILVNGAAGNFLCPASELTYNGFSTILDIDAKGTWNVSRAVYSAWMCS